MLWFLLISILFALRSDATLRKAVPNTAKSKRRSNTPFADTPEDPVVKRDGEQLARVITTQMFRMLTPPSSNAPSQQQIDDSSSNISLLQESEAVDSSPSRAESAIRHSSQQNTTTTSHAQALVTLLNFRSKKLMNIVNNCKGTFHLT